MHIGFLTPDLTYSHGWGHYSLSLILALCRAGINLTIVSARNSPPVQKFHTRPILPPLVPAERFMLPRTLLISREVHTLLGSCDIIHATAEPYAPLATWIAGNRPAIITGHGSYVRIARQRHWPVNLIYEHAFRHALTVCVSRYTARTLNETLPNARSVVINNGIDVERFAHLPPLEEPKFAPVVLCVGAVKARKGVLELVRAMAVVRQHIQDAQCIIIGSLTAEPAYVQQVRMTITEHGLEGHVHLMGHVPEQILYAWYGAADIFALPSMNDGWKFEGYGLAHLEASAAGLPVIGTTDCGAEDAIDDGVTGLLIPQSQVSERLPQAIVTVLRDKDLARRMGEAGRKKAQSQTWDHVAGNMIALYEDVLKHT